MHIIHKGQVNYIRGARSELEFIYEIMDDAV